MRLAKQLPDGWKWSCLGDVAEYVNGRAFKPGEWVVYGLPIIRIQNLNDPGASFNHFPHPVEDRYKVSDGDLLISWSASLDAYIWNRGDAVLNQHIFNVKEHKQKVNRRYLYYFVRSAMTQIRDQVHGATMQHITKGRFESIPIPLPPLPEQRRIAAILDKADALREKRRQAIAKLDTLLQSVFLEMFGDPMKNQKGWPWGKISDLCKDIVDCPHSTPTYAVTATAYACWRSSDIQNGYIDKTATKYVYLEEYNQRIQRTPPKKGDVIYCREGARFGNAARILDDEKSCLGQRMMLMRAAPSKGTPEYLWAFLNAKSTYQKMVSLVGGSASPHVNVKEIKHFAAPIPPFQLQEKFSMLVHLIDQMRERSHMSLDMLESLFSSLQQRAFTGQLFTEKSAAAAQQELFAGS